MAKILINGSAAADNDAHNYNTHLLLIGARGEPVLIDAGSNPLGKI
ncbi:MAG: hypothetical protein H7Y11_01520, partial [Armatimonadetes bacterium]|nr:hypothetical protein [Anaerolineae bacterium]